MSPSAVNKPGVLMLGEIVHAHNEFAALSQCAEVEQLTSGTRDQFLQRCRSGAYDHIKAISRTVESAQYTGLFDAELVEALPASIKFIVHNGAGYDQIDAKACSARGILVSNTPTAVDAATADVAMFLIIGALRKAWIAQSAIRAGDFRGRTPVAHDPEGKTLGILGMGGIGSALAQRAAAFGFRVQYHNRRPVAAASSSSSSSSSSSKTGAVAAQYVGFEELLRTSDVVSVHLPLTPETRHRIGRRELDMMKHGVTIVNTARGAVIDEQALVDVLDADDGRIWSVGLDVFDGEPRVHPKLLANENIMILPHIGTCTVETQKKMEVLAVDNVRSAVANDRLLTPVNEIKS